MTIAKHKVTMAFVREGGIKVHTCIQGKHRFGFRENRCHCGVLIRNSDGAYSLCETTQKLLDWAKRVKLAAAKISQEVDTLKAKISEKGSVT
jgi:hypothetical protein